MTKSAYLSATLLIALLCLSVSGKTQTPGATGSPDVIEMTAKAYEFSPDEVHVKTGSRVQIKLRSLDRGHGLNLNLYPEGATQDGNVGLVFDQPQGEAKVEKKQDAVIEFVAARPGTYIFKCSVKCSMFGGGHDKMTGKLIVE